MRAQLGIARANKVSNRTVAGDGIIRGDRRQETRAVGSANAKGLAANAERDLQAVREQKDLVLSKERHGSLLVRRVVNRAEGRRRRLKDRFVLVFKTTGSQVVPAESKVRGSIKRVGAAVIDALEGEVAERIQSRELWIEVGP